MVFWIISQKEKISCPFRLQWSNRGHHIYWQLSTIPKLSNDDNVPAQKDPIHTQTFHPGPGRLLATLVRLVIFGTSYGAQIETLRMMAWMKQSAL